MKRFTETTKWSDPWFMDLPVKYKAFWFYICDECDCAGVWEPNIRLAITQIGEPLELVEILRVFTGRIEQLKDGKLWVKKFIPFQYGILSPDCKPHLAVLKRLENLGLSKGYPKGIHTLKEKEKDKEKEKEGGVQRGKSEDMSESEWLKELSEDKAFEGIDVEKEHAKAFRWCKENRRLLTRKFFLNWLNRVDRRMTFEPSKPMTKYGIPLPDRCTIARNGDVLDNSGRIMDINQVRKANEL